MTIWGLLFAFFLAIPMQSCSANSAPIETIQCEVWSHASGELLFTIDLPESWKENCVVYRGPGGMYIYFYGKSELGKTENNYIFEIGKYSWFRYEKNIEIYFLENSKTTDDYVLAIAETQLEFLNISKDEYAALSDEQKQLYEQDKQTAKDMLKDINKIKDSFKRGDKHRETTPNEIGLPFYAPEYSIVLPDSWVGFCDVTDYNIDIPIVFCGESEDFLKELLGYYGYDMFSVTKFLHETDDDKIETNLMWKSEYEEAGFDTSQMEFLGHGGDRDYYLIPVKNYLPSCFNLTDEENNSLTEEQKAIFDADLLRMKEIMGELDLIKQSFKYYKYDNLGMLIPDGIDCEYDPIGGFWVRT